MNNEDPVVAKAKALWGARTRSQKGCLLVFVFFWFMGCLGMVVGDPESRKKKPARADDFEVDAETGEPEPVARTEPKLSPNPKPKPEPAKAKPKAPKVEAPAPAPKPRLPSDFDFHADVDEIMRAYEANGVEADQRFRLKRIRTAGEVTLIDQRQGVAYITLHWRDDTFKTVQCIFRGDEIANLSNITKGSWVVVVGTKTGHSINVLLDHCVLIP